MPLCHAVHVASLHQQTWYYTSMMMVEARVVAVVVTLVLALVVLVVALAVAMEVAPLHQQT